MLAALTLTTTALVLSPTVHTTRNYNNINNIHTTTTHTNLITRAPQPQAFIF